MSITVRAYTTSDGFEVLADEWDPLHREGAQSGRGLQFCLVAIQAFTTRHIDR